MNYLNYLHLQELMIYFNLFKCIARLSLHLLMHFFLKIILNLIPDSSAERFEAELVDWLPWQRLAWLLLADSAWLACRSRL